VTNGPSLPTYAENAEIKIVRYAEQKRGCWTGGWPTLPVFADVATNEGAPSLRTLQGWVSRTHKSGVVANFLERRLSRVATAVGRKARFIKINVS
jgi:hypothetical protein